MVIQLWDKSDKSKKCNFNKVNWWVEYLFSIAKCKNQIKLDYVSNVFNDCINYLNECTVLFVCVFILCVCVCVCVCFHGCVLNACWFAFVLRTDGRLVLTHKILSKKKQKHKQK